MSAHQMPQGRLGTLRFDFNENTIGCSPAARAAVSRLTREQISVYPEYEAARRRLARYFRVTPRELLLTNGVDDALKLVIDAFISPGDAVLVVEPTFDMYRFYAALAGARLRVERLDADMRLPVDAVLRALRRHPRVFLLANPNNPTGTLIGKSVLRRILEVATHTLVVVDEAYSEFSPVTVLPWIRRYPNLVVTRTFSKAAGLAALRFGCLFANRQLAAELRKVQPPFPVNTAAVVAAEAAIRETSYTRRYVREVQKSRLALEQALRCRGVRVFPSAANFLLADFGSRARSVLRALARQGIRLRDRTHDFGRPGYIRITLGTPAQTRKLIRSLEALW